MIRFHGPRAETGSDLLRYLGIFLFWAVMFCLAAALPR